MVLGIFLIVRLDVGINTTIYNYFTTLFNFNTNEAISSISIYFLAKILGTFIGAILLQKIKPDIFFRIITILIVLFTFLFILSHSAFLSKIYLFLIGLFAANVFPIIFSLAIQKLPEYLEELSGLLY
jgi:fucose permease